MLLRRLDARMSGFGFFSHGVFFHAGSAGRREFSEIRQWCWESWGGTTELDIWQERYGSKLANPAWSWQRPEGRGPRIYLATEREVSMYLLKWS